MALRAICTARFSASRSVTAAARRLHRRRPPSPRRRRRPAFGHRCRTCRRPAPPGGARIRNVSNLRGCSHVSRTPFAQLLQAARRLFLAALRRLPRPRQLAAVVGDARSGQLVAAARSGQRGRRGSRNRQPPSRPSRPRRRGERRRSKSPSPPVCPGPSSTCGADSSTSTCVGPSGVPLRVADLDAGAVERDSPSPPTIPPS